MDFKQKFLKEIKNRRKFASKGGGIPRNFALLGAKFLGILPPLEKGGRISYRGEFPVTSEYRRKHTTLPRASFHMTSKFETHRGTLI